MSKAFNFTSGFQQSGPKFLTHIYFLLLEKKLSYGFMAFISKCLMYDEIKHIDFEDMQVFISKLTNYSGRFKSVRGSLIIGWFSIADSLCKLLENTPHLPVEAEGLFKVDSSHVFEM